MQRAIALVRVLFHHQRALHSLMGKGDRALYLAQRLARSILADGMPEVDRRGLFQSCRSFREAGINYLRDDALQLLVDCQWLAVMPGKYETARPTHWAVNSRAHERFGNIGLEHQKRRAIIRAAIIGNASDED